MFTWLRKLKELFPRMVQAVRKSQGMESNDKLDKKDLFSQQILEKYDPLPEVSSRNLQMVYRIASRHKLPEQFDPKPWVRKMEQANKKHIDTEINKQKALLAKDLKLSIWKELQDRHDRWGNDFTNQWVLQWGQLTISRMNGLYRNHRQQIKKELQLDSSPSTKSLQYTKAVSLSVKPILTYKKANTATHTENATTSQKGKEIKETSVSHRQNTTLSPYSSNELNLIVDQVYREIERKMKLERQRRGL